MTRPRLVPWLLLALAALAPGCGKPTEIVLSVVKNIPFAEMDSVRVTVLGGDGKVSLSTQLDLDATQSDYALLPGTLGLVPSGDDSGVVTIKLAGMLSGNPQPVIERDATLTFVPGRILLLRLALSQPCYGSASTKCEALGQTCVDGACEPYEVDSSSLPDFDAQPSGGAPPGNQAACGTAAQAASFGLTAAASVACPTGQLCTDALQCVHVAQPVDGGVADLAVMDMTVAAGDMADASAVTDLAGLDLASPDLAAPGDLSSLRDLTAPVESGAIGEGSDMTVVAPQPQVQWYSPLPQGTALTSVATDPTSATGARVWAASLGGDVLHVTAAGALVAEDTHAAVPLRAVAVSGGTVYAAGDGAAILARSSSGTWQPLVDTSGDIGASFIALAPLSGGQALAVGKAQPGSPPVLRVVRNGTVVTSGALTTDGTALQPAAVAMASDGSLGFLVGTGTSALLHRYTPATGWTTTNAADVALNAALAPGGTDVLDGVALSGTRAMVVGSSSGRSLAWLYDGSAWSDTSPPDVGPLVAVAGGTTALAVGTTGLLAWNGSQWSVLPTTGAPTTGQAVAYASATGAFELAAGTGIDESDAALTSWSTFGAQPASALFESRGTQFTVVDSGGLHALCAPAGVAGLSCTNDFRPTSLGPYQLVGATPGTPSIDVVSGYASGGAVQLYAASSDGASVYSGLGFTSPLTVQCAQSSLGPATSIWAGLLFGTPTWGVTANQMGSGSGVEADSLVDSCAPAAASPGIVYFGMTGLAANGHLYFTGTTGGQSFVYDRSRGGTASIQIPGAAQSVWAASPTSLWAAGQNGTVWHITGTDQSSDTLGMQAGTLVTLHALMGTSDTDIFAVGDAGTLVHFDGATWTRLDSRINTNLVSLYVDASWVFASDGSDDMIYIQR